MNQGDIIRTDPTTRSFVHSIPTVVNPEKFCSLKEEVRLCLGGRCGSIFFKISAHTIFFKNKKYMIFSKIYGSFL
jgi:hypothetical protein